MIKKLLCNPIINWNIQIVGYVLLFGILGQVIGDFGVKMFFLAILICLHNFIMEMNVKYFSVTIFPLPAPSFFPVERITEIIWVSLSAKKQALENVLFLCRIDSLNCKAVASLHFNQHSHPYLKENFL